MCCWGLSHFEFIGRSHASTWSQSFMGEAQRAWLEERYTYQLSELLMDVVAQVSHQSYCVEASSMLKNCSRTYGQSGCMSLITMLWLCASMNVRGFNAYDDFVVFIISLNSRGIQFC
mmetsp:Transcript_117527/g.184819  ORF Transcript_117527/g.184819 Transcript_117527/m.184819 type:complete len:117 (+) Transcript_117527:135-485(+)